MANFIALAAARRAVIPGNVREEGVAAREALCVRLETLDAADVPLTECLKDTVVRFLPYWHGTIAPAITSGKKVIVASTCTVVAARTSCRGAIRSWAHGRASATRASTEDIQRTVRMV